MNLEQALHFVYPAGKPMIPHLPRCQGFGVDDYSQPLDALQLRHPQLSLNQVSILRTMHHIKTE
jgi:hypothetical protein